MSVNDKIILVAGATGQQGGATTRHLLAKGWSVRALTRNPNSPAAQALTAAGTEVVQGDLGDQMSLNRALDGVYGVFSVQTPESGVEIEEQQGKALADAGKSPTVAASRNGVILIFFSHFGTNANLSSGLATNRLSPLLVHLVDVRRLAIVDSRGVETFEMGLKTLEEIGIIAALVRFG